MKTKTLRRVSTAVFVYIYLSSTFPVLACHTVAAMLPDTDACTGDQSLAQTQNAVDLWRLSCPAGTTEANAFVWDLNPVDNDAKLRVRVFRSGLSDSETDVTPNPYGEGQGPSAEAVRTGAGMGIYDVTFFQDQMGPEGYRGEANCNGPGGTLGGTFTRVQNQ